MPQSLKNFLSKPAYTLLFFAAISAASLGMALISQYVFGLQPCILCHYQRVPFAINIALGLLGALLAYKQPKTAPMFLGATSLVFLANSVIAFYHTGVERHWWKSFLEACTIPDFKGDITDVLAQITATPAARCDEIPWVDPVIGLSMANYNVVMCLGLAIIALASLVLSCRKRAVSV